MIGRKELEAMNKKAHCALHPAGEPPTVRKHSLLEDCWVVLQDTIHGPVMTSFQGPCAEWRARQYARAELLDLDVDNGDTQAAEFSA